MKNLIYVFSFLMMSSLYAQEKKPVDKTEETKTIKTTVNKNGEKVSVNTVKVTTTKEQEIKTEQKNGNTVNGDKIDTPVKVTKTIEISSDSNPFSTASDKVVYYTYNDEKFTFTPDNSGFLMSLPENISYGQARKSLSNHFYLMTIKNNPGVGYFDSNGNFVVEYFDQEKDVMMMQSFEISKF